MTTSLTDTLAAALRAVLAAHDAPTYSDSLAYADHMSEAVEPARAALAEYDARPTPPTRFDYSAWRHGGWYVHNVRYPSGAVGCVSRNYADRKWRIVCADFDTSPTYASRDAAALAEWTLAQAEGAAP